MSEHTQTSLEQKLITYIRVKGPISVRAFMEACLYDPEHGYYRNGNPIGEQGDFITAPEISQMFGEMISVWSLLTWQAMGSPIPFQIVELGPGRGTLMSDVLRSLSNLHPNFETITVHLVERSASLAAHQKHELGTFDCSLVWHEKIEDIPSGPTLLIANEFLDCLPIRQFIKKEHHWHERMVAVDQQGRLCFVVGPELPKGMYIPQRFQTAATGSIFEFCPEFEMVMKNLNSLAGSHPFAGLFIDYGFEGPALGETLQSVYKHKMISPFHDPGNVDLTAHVDFTALAALAVALGMKAYGPRDQGAFLSQLGIGARAEILVQNASDAQSEKLITDVVRLVAPEQMGSLFKAMCITSSGVAIPAPFDQQIEVPDVQETN